ncbi:hypothetical protein HQ520_14525 [bacterium]|nr:hypothetical protein [bacterium]
MAISVIDPFSPAFERTRTILFRPFDLAKWLLLGFCAFLAQLTQSRIQPPVSFSHRGRMNFSGMENSVRHATRELEGFMTIPMLLGGFALLLLVLGLLLLFLWFGSRGRFMFLHCVVQNRAAVVEPWRQFRPHGNSLFRFRIVLVLACSGVMLLIGIAAVAVIMFGSEWTLLLVLGLAVLAPIALIMLFAFALVGLVLRDFIVPIMYLGGLPVLKAFQVFLREILPGRLGVLVLYYLVRIGMGFLFGFAMALLTCVTCCIAALPYISSVFFLPLTVFVQCYTLQFLQQFGPEFVFFPKLATPEGPESPQEI